MVKAKYYNNVNVINTKRNKKVEKYSGIVQLNYEVFSQCVKLGVGTMYDDHCADSVVLKSVTYDNILAFGEDTIKLVSDLSIIKFKKDIKIQVLINGKLEKEFAADEKIISDIFLISSSIYSPYGYVDTITHIPEFDNTPYPHITTDYLNKKFNIPSNLDWYEEGDHEAGIEPDTYLELGYNKRKYAFIDMNKEVKVKKENEKVKYLEEKDFYDNNLKEIIENIKKTKENLYVIGFQEIEFPNLSWESRQKFSPYYEEYLKVVKNYDYNNLFVVETEAGNFIANKKDKVWNVKVPDNKKGLFIGKGGANIKELARKYKVRINVI